MAKSSGQVRCRAPFPTEQPAPISKLMKRKSTNLHVDQVEKLAADHHKAEMD